MIFTARQLQEKCKEQNLDLYMTFVDLTKAFHTVSRVGLWKIMVKLGCPTKFIAVVKQFHDGMLARVQNDGEFSDPFPVRNGAKQGCVLAPTLFRMMVSAMLTAAFQDGDNGIPIRYRFDGKLFNLRPASVAQLDAPSDWRSGGRGFNPRRGRQHSFVKIGHEIFSTVILSLPLIQEGQLSVSGERMCTILVNCLEDSGP